MPKVLLAVLLPLLLSACGVTPRSIVDDVFYGRGERRAREREEELSRTWEAERAAWEREAREAEGRRRVYVSAHPEMEEDLQRDILAGLAGVGMTREQVRASWGDPDRVNPMGGSSRSIEIWLYGRKQLTFTEGYLTGLYDPDRD